MGRNLSAGRSSATYPSATYLFLLSGSLGKIKLPLCPKQMCRIHVLMFGGLHSLFSNITTHFLNT